MKNFFYIKLSMQFRTLWSMVVITILILKNVRISELVRTIMPVTAVLPSCTCTLSMRPTFGLILVPSSIEFMLYSIHSTKNVIQIIRK